MSLSFFLRLSFKFCVKKRKLWNITLFVFACVKIIFLTKLIKMHLIITMKWFLKEAENLKGLSLLLLLLLLLLLWLLWKSTVAIFQYIFNIKKKIIDAKTFIYILRAFVDTNDTPYILLGFMWLLLYSKFSSSLFSKFQTSGFWVWHFYILFYSIYF